MGCISQILEEQDIEEAVTDDTRLFSGGLLDSMAMIRMVSMLERALDITMYPGEVTVDAFDTVAGIAGAIQRSISR